ncbi:major capsid protein [bacterium]|nr:major capsid protein [bacterium]
MPIPTIADYPQLRPQVLQKVIESAPAPTFIGSELLPDEPDFTDTFTWEVLDRGRQRAGLVPRDGEARIVPFVPQEVKTAPSAFIKAKMLLVESILEYLRYPGTYAAAAEKQVAEAVLKLNRQVDIEKEWLIMTALSTGAITYTETGGYSFSVDYGVPNSNKPTASPLWSSTSTADVIGNVLAWKQIIAENGGTNIVGLCNSTVFGYMIQNAAIRQLLQGNIINPTDPSIFATILGLQKLYVYDAVYTDLDGSTTAKFLPNDKFILLALGEAGDRFGGFRQAPSLYNNHKPGRFVYTSQTDDPAGIWVIVGEYGLPVIYHPNWLVIADVA